MPYSILAVETREVKVLLSLTARRRRRRQRGEYLPSTGSERLSVGASADRWMNDANDFITLIILLKVK